VQYLVFEALLVSIREATYRTYKNQLGKQAFDLLKRGFRSVHPPPRTRVYKFTPQIT